MLVLTRKVGEIVDVGPCSVQVVKIDGGKVRLGIVAPKNVPVLRREVSLRGLTRAEAPDQERKGVHDATGIDAAEERR
jgi:carbon storage regulator